MRGQASERIRGLRQVWGHGGFMILDSNATYTFAGDIDTEGPKGSTYNHDSRFSILTEDIREKEHIDCRM